MSAHVEQIDTRTVSEEVLVALHEYYVVMRAEEMPDDPPTPLARDIANWRHGRESEEILRWLLWDGGELIGLAVTHIDLEQNLDNGFARVHVRQDRRHQGNGRLIAGDVFDYLDAHDRTRLHTYVVEGAAEEALCERMGLKSVYREKVSRVVITDIDRGLMESWVERAAERASAYHLLRLDAPFPDEVVEPYCEMLFAMNTAPMEEFEMEDEVMTPVNWRDTERFLDNSQRDLLTLIAVETDTGEFVGSTSIQTDRLDPAHAFQWETVVHPDHRNRGLGRWLKGANVLRVIDEHPDVERIDTENAGSNEPMLNINVAMGFRPILITNAWQGETEVARAALGL